MDIVCERRGGKFRRQGVGPIILAGTLPMIPSHEFQFWSLEFAFAENRTRLERGYEESCDLMQSLAKYKLAHE